MTDKIKSYIEDGVGWLVFNSPEKRNAISLAMAARGAEVIQEYVNNPDVRVVVLKGEGDKAFVSGADISEFEEKRAGFEGMAEYERISSRLFETIHECPKPVIAMIRGYCMGGGVALACACDFRICSDDSIFAIPAARLSIAYKPAFTRWVMQAVGPSVAKEILITARRYDAQEAYHYGLVNRVTAPDELEAFVTGYAAQIVSNAPLSVLAAKGIVRSILDGAGQEDAEACKKLMDACAGSDDYIEGRRAFMEKRKPVFQGK